MIAFSIIYFFFFLLEGVTVNKSIVTFICVYITHLTVWKTMYQAYASRLLTCSPL